MSIPIIYEGTSESLRALRVARLTQACESTKRAYNRLATEMKESVLKRAGALELTLMADDLERVAQLLKQEANIRSGEMLKGHAEAMEREGKGVTVPNSRGN